MSINRVPVLKQMRPRDTEESHRVATSLELSMGLTVLLVGLALAAAVVQHVVSAERPLR